MLKYKYIFQTKFTEAILSSSTRKLLRFEIAKMLIAVLKNNFVSFIIIFGTLSLPSNQTAFVNTQMQKPQVYFYLIRDFYSTALR